MKYKKRKAMEKRRRVFQHIKLQRDTWQRPRPAGSTPHWCSSLHRALLHRSTAQWWDAPQSRPPWSPPATGIQESNAKLDQKQWRWTQREALGTRLAKKIQGFVKFHLITTGELPSVSTSVMHLVSSWRSMSLGIVIGLFSKCPLYFLRSNVNIAHNNEQWNTERRLNWNTHMHKLPRTFWAQNSNWVLECYFSPFT